MKLTGALRHIKLICIRAMLSAINIAFLLLGIIGCAVGAVFIVTVTQTA